LANPAQFIRPERAEKISGEYLAAMETENEGATAATEGEERCRPEAMKKLGPAWLADPHKL
jgi:hypothetical protein